MWIFTTREVSVIIYSIVFLIYVLIKKGKSVFLPVIKAACHIKLIVPFIFIVTMAIIFVWICKLLPFWNWIYVKDITFWVLFVGIPTCFNSVANKLEDHYFRNILIDNFKFTALVEFITGTFTFPLAVELILQPILLFFALLQLMAGKDEYRSIKKLIDAIVAIVGFSVLAFTVKAAIDAIGNTQFIDIAIGFILPIVLSVLYLPIAYCFAVYSKYEILFLRMSFKEPQSKKVKLMHRIKVIRLCGLSYKRICKFLHEYIPKMYIKMSNSEFDSVINDFKHTTYES